MKIHILATAVLLIGVSFSVMAQADKDDVRIGLALLNKNTKAIITQTITLDETQKAEFWKIYDEYENKYDRLLFERIEIIQQFAEQYETLNDSSAAKITEGLLKNTVRIDELHASYFPKFKKALGGTKAATLYQLELYIQTDMQHKVQEQLPIIGQLKNNVDKQ